ncbi:MAG TPA: M20/M25/M40 family metallo-hydrolase, partial [Oligoflexia bacterium]|nr:M20/M25/M40 family metallo-hydrolase [Oligoflexia bacterium]
MGRVRFASRYCPSRRNFDRAAGVVSGLESLIKIFSSDSSRKRGLRLRVWRCEESATFNSVYAGSLGAFGQARPDCLNNHFRGISLAEAIRSQGADPDYILYGKRTISTAELDSIAAHIELHIEQGNLLEKEHLDIGVVTGIRGPYRSRIILRGEFDHSGATPMGTDYRRDANLALGYILVELDKLAAQHISQGADLVQTIGVINSQKDWNEKHSEVYQNAVTKVSGYACFTLDARSDDGVFLAAYREEADEAIQQTAAKFGVEAEQSLIGFEPGIKVLDSHLAGVIEHAAQELGLSCKRMPSGAGHDAAIVGKQKKSNGLNVPVGMIFIPCRRGKSHS